MNTTATPNLTAANPLRLQGRSITWQVAAVVLGTLFLAVMSYIEVPMLPVPMNMQTFGVAMVGALYGWRLGGITVIAWLAEAALGAPVLSGGAAGAIHFVGPTAGYLFAFPVVAALVGWLAERGWNGAKPLLAVVAALAGNALCLALGGLWLATSIGADQAFIYGVAPFVTGALLKSVLGGAVLFVLHRAASKGTH